MNHHYCQACNSTACDGNCFRPTDKAAIEAQHRRDCAAVDEDANPRRQGECYFEKVLSSTLTKELELEITPLEAHAVLYRLRPYFKDSFVAGAKWACGAVDYEKEAAGL